MGRGVPVLLAVEGAYQLTGCSASQGTDGKGCPALAVNRLDQATSRKIEL